MISRAITASGFSNLSHQGLHNMFPPAADDNLVESAPSQSSSLMFNLSVLKDKLTHLQNLAGILLSSDQILPDSTCTTLASMNSIIQEFIVTASSMMLTCQHMVLNFSPPPPPPPPPPGTHHCTESNFGNYTTSVTNNIAQHRGPQGIFSSPNDQSLDWFGGESYDNNLKDDDPSVGIIETKRELCQGDETNESKNEDMIIELDASDLLEKYTHYCQICGKGFKRDANLRMHMRAHGDEYKTSAALSNPMKKNREKECSMSSTTFRPKKYSCPQEGCRWNQKHAKFQPLKSMICVKNHYKRSHCPKMYVCKRCNLKHFSVLSDLRTHEKHCGDLKWLCSCGTTFSRKDKLMGHVALFVGHAPAVGGALSYSRKLQLQEDGSSSR